MVGFTHKVGYSVSNVAFIEYASFLTFAFSMKTIDIDNIDMFLYVRCHLLT